MKLSRITFTYGLLWEHENLTPLTHDTLHEFFGYITAECSAQLALTMREKKLVSASGKDIYLPDVDEDDRMDSAAYRKHINRLDMPICFIVGKRKISLKSTTTRMALVLSYVHNKEIRKAKGHGFMETKTKVDALFNILFYIHHNNGKKKNAYCNMYRVIWLGYNARGGERPSQSPIDSMCQFVHFVTQPSLINQTSNAPLFWCHFLLHCVYYMLLTSVEPVFNGRSIDLRT